METTKPKPFVFVLMPFSEEMMDLYTLGIQPACADAGAYCERVDEQIFQGSILERLINQISKADIIVAVMTGKNPNVFYETGYAHALGKTTILLTNDSKDIPFDLAHRPHIIYENAIRRLKEALFKQVKYFLENPNEPSTTPSIALDFYEGGKPITDGSFFDVQAVNTTLNFHIDVHNPTNGVVPSGKIKLTLTSSELLKESTKDRFSTHLPGGQYMIDLPQLPNMLPQSWTQLRFQVYRPKGPSFKTGDQIGLTFTLFTEAGVRTVSPVAFINLAPKKYSQFSLAPHAGPTDEA